MKGPAHLRRYLQNDTSTQWREIKIIASNNVSFYKGLFFPLRREALKRVSTEIWGFFLWKELLRLQTFFTLTGKKNNCRNDKVVPKAKIKTGIRTSGKNQEKQNVHLIRLYKCLCYEYIYTYIYIYVFSRNTTSVSRAYCRLHSITHFPSGNI